MSAARAPSKQHELSTTILDAIHQWDLKTNQLMQLAQKYHGHLDTQQQHFCKLKVLLQEKDLVIGQLQ